MKISKNGRETIRRMLDNRIIFYLVKILRFIGNRLVNEGGM